MTSRSRLSTLAGRGLLQLEVLPPAASVALLGTIIGEPRTAAEPEAVAELAEACGGLPLALRICGARLSARSTWSIAVLNARLRESRRRLDEFATEDLEIRASFESSLSSLSSLSRPTGPDAAAAGTANPAPGHSFHLLGLLRGGDFGVAAAAAVLDTAVEAAEAVVEQLVDAHLLDSPRAGRYRFHDLIRELARERAQALESESARREALVRWIGWSRATAAAAERLVNARRQPIALERKLDRAGEDLGHGRPSTADQAWSWLDEELTNVAAAALAAAELDRPAETVAIALALAQPARVRGRWPEAEALLRLGLAGARQLGDDEAISCAINDLAIVMASQFRFDEAILAFQQGADHARVTGNVIREAQARLNLAITARKLGDPAQAIATLTEATALLDRHDHASPRPDPMSIRIRRTVLLCLGASHREAGRLAQARANLAEVMSLAQQAGDQHHITLAWEALGKLHLDAGEHHDAARCYRTALEAFEAQGDQEATATTLRYLGEALLADSDAAGAAAAGAAAAWTRSHGLYVKLNDPRVADLTNLLDALPR